MSKGVRSFLLLPSFLPFGRRLKCEMSHGATSLDGGPLSSASGIHMSPSSLMQHPSRALHLLLFPSILPFMICGQFASSVLLSAFPIQLFPAVGPRGGFDRFVSL